ncbi:MAG: hypothetical protein K9M81_05705 [Chthoniobacterales bacterium]|nr:hypothetical protein [Chthoniobacterales bacterium]
MRTPDGYCVSFELLLGQYETYSRRRNPSPSLSASGFAAPRDDQYEICGLNCLLSFNFFG